MLEQSISEDMFWAVLQYSLHTLSLGVVFKQALFVPVFTSALPNCVQNPRGSTEFWKLLKCWPNTNLALPVVVQDGE